jgi:seryl-tRNA synthetase
VTTRDTRDEQLSESDYNRHRTALWQQVDEAWRLERLDEDRRAPKDEIKTLRHENLLARQDLSEVVERAEKAERALAEVEPFSPEWEAAQDEAAELRSDHEAHVKEGEDV